MILPDSTAPALLPESCQEFEFDLGVTSDDDIFDNLDSLDVDSTDDHSDSDSDDG
jgi:hypothetical protein